ncbi:hypothetical protein GPALN_010794 [Globodera pallida]|nr:hypothetical protein GPALN_010794 [Globodera pallida]
MVGIVFSLVIFGRQLNAHDDLIDQTFLISYQVQTAKVVSTELGSSVDVQDGAAPISRGIGSAVFLATCDSFACADADFFSKEIRLDSTFHPAETPGIPQLDHDEFIRFVLTRCRQSTPPTTGYPTSQQPDI